MMKFLRSQSQTVLVIVLGVIGLGFLFYGSSGTLLTAPGGRASNDYGQIDGQNLSLADLSNAVHSAHDALVMRGQPGTGPEVAEEAWVQLLLLHEADRLHIEISDKEIVDHIHNEPVFQKDGVYSPQVFQEQMAILQNQLHISPDTFAALERDNLRTGAVSRALFASIRSGAGDVSAQYDKFYGPATVSLVSIDPKAYADTATVTPGEIEAQYKAHPDNPDYRTNEKRKVDYVLFLLSPDQAKLPEKEKADAKEALGEKALDFALAFQPDPAANPGPTPPPPDFLAEAKKRSLVPASTDYFAADTPPANVPPSPSFNSAAFSLTKDASISKVVELDNGVAVLHLVDIQSSELRPLDEVKAVITKQLQQVKGAQTAQGVAQVEGQLLKALVAKGADFKTAAANMKLKVETVPPFVPFVAMKSQADPRLQTIAYAVMSLAPGQVSDPVPLQSDNTTLIVHLDSRAQPDPAGLAEFENRYRQSQDDELRKSVYFDWVTWQSKQPGTHKPPDLDAYGSVE